MYKNEIRNIEFVPPVPFKLPKLLDLSEWELLLASPADPDFAIFPFSRIHKQENKETTQRSGLNNRFVTSAVEKLQSQMTQLQFPTFLGFLPQFKCYCEGLGYSQSHCLSLGNRKQYS